MNGRPLGLMKNGLSGLADLLLFPRIRRICLFSAKVSFFVRGGGELFDGRTDGRADSPRINSDNAVANSSPGTEIFFFFVYLL